MPEIWHEVAQLPTLKEHAQSLLVYIREHKDELTSHPRNKEFFFAFVQSFLPPVMDRVLMVQKPDENEIWNWFIKLFDDLHELTRDCSRGCTHGEGEPECGLDEATGQQVDRVRSFRRLLASRESGTAY